MEWDIHPHTVEGDLPHTSHLARTRSSIGVGTSTRGARVSTNGAQVPTASSCYACMDWVSKIIMSKLKSIAQQCKLGDKARWPGPNNRPHLPSSNYITFSEGS